jgi:hypothetical protein
MTNWWSFTANWDSCINNNVGLYTSINSSPNAPVLSAPADQTKNIEITPILFWNPSFGTGLYNLQISSSSTDWNSPIFNISNIKGTTPFYNIQSPLSNNQTYYWRVKANNSFGSGSWSVVRSFTTIQNEPSIITLLSPINFSNNISTNTLLKWSISDAASSYRLQISSKTDFSTVIIDDSSLITTSYTINNLANNTTYYWRVKAKNNAGTSEWSEAWSFTTIALKPETVTLSSPLNSSTGISINPVLNWNLSTGVSSYRVQVSTTSTFLSVIIDDSSLTVASKTLSNLSNNLTYYWRVKAKNAAGVSDWSEVRSFTTIMAKPSIVILSNPIKSDTGVAINPTLYWYALNGATSYRLQLSVSSTFSSIVFDDSSITEHSKSLKGLLSNKTYYWKVNAKNMGGTGDWSEIWNFKTMKIKPLIVNILTPIDSSLGVPLNPILRWKSEDNADSYKFQISQDSLFNTFIKDTTCIKDTMIQMQNLLCNSKYYWRVSATNSIGNGDWSEVWNFKTVYDTNTLLLLHFDNIVTGEDGENPILSSGITYEKGVYNYGILIDNNDILKYPMNENFNPQQGTIEFWMKPKWNGNNNKDQAFLGISSNSFLQKDAANNFRFILNGENSEGHQGYNLGAWKSNTWHYVVVTWSIPGYMKSYFDGGNRISHTSTIQNDLITNLQEPIFIGSRNGLTQVEAIYDEFKISTQVRTPSEIYASYLQGLAIVSKTEEKGNVIPNYNLKQNYPNPFNPSTVISFQLSDISHVSLKIYDILGREVANLVDKRMDAGVHEVTFEPKDLPGGVYLYKLKAEQYEEMKKMVYLK